MTIPHVSIGDDTTLSPKGATRSTRRTVIWSVSVAVTLLVALGITFALLFFERPEATDGKTPIPIGAEAGATIVPAKGWWVTGGASDRVTITSPDGVCRVTATAPNAQPPSETMSAVLDNLPEASQADPKPQVFTESLRSGLTASHTVVGSKLYVAVGDADRSVLLEAEVGGKTEDGSQVLGIYRPALVELLATMQLP